MEDAFKKYLQHAVGGRSSTSAGDVPTAKTGAQLAVIHDEDGVVWQHTDEDGYNNQNDAVVFSDVDDEDDDEDIEDKESDTQDVEEDSDFEDFQAFCKEVEESAANNKNAVKKSATNTKVLHIMVKSSYIEY